MKTLLTFLTLLFTITVHAGTMPLNNVANLTGFYCTNTITSVDIIATVPIATSGVPTGNSVTLHTATYTAGGEFFALYDGMSNNQYRVPSGKKFYPTRECSTSSSNTRVSIGAATATWSDGTGSTPTGWINIGGGTTATPLWTGFTNNGSTSGVIFCCYTFAGLYWDQLYYPGVISAGTAGTTYVQGFVQ